MTPIDAGAVRAARALRAGIPEAIEQRDLDALIDNLAGWFTTDLEARDAARMSLSDPGPPDPEGSTPSLSSDRERTTDHG